jgi:hypothetical protein
MAGDGRIGNPPRTGGESPLSDTRLNSTRAGFDDDPWLSLTDRIGRPLLSRRGCRTTTWKPSFTLGGCQPPCTPRHSEWPWWEPGLWPSLPIPCSRASALM